MLISRVHVRVDEEEETKINLYFFHLYYLILENKITFANFWRIMKSFNNKINK